MAGMAGRDAVTTYEQLHAMSPRARREHFRAALVLDPAQFRPNERALIERLDAPVSPLPQHPALS